jgi:hypothetical protein
VSLRVVFERSRVARAVVTILVLTLVQISASVTAPAPAVAATFGSSACASDFSNTANVEEIVQANYCVVRIKSGTTTWTPLSGVQSLYVLAVGGGGGGGNNAGGGGAGGAVAYGKYTVGASISVTITVGNGGAGGLASGEGTTLMDGQVGGSTTVVANTGVMSLTAAGGSGGETHWSSNQCGGTGAPTVNVSGGTISSSGAYTAITNSSGGSGGGWAASGVNGGAGGAGNSRNITGTAISYGAGGGGGAWNASGGAGGTTGGGAGGASGTAGTAGTANTGSGGGGGGDGCSNGGTGGSGVVVLKWIPTPIVATPANATSLAGRTTTFTTSATSSTTLTRSYTWGVSSDSGANYTTVTDGSGATTTTFTTGTNIKSEDGYRYRMGVTDTDATITTVGYSAGGVLTVNYHPGFETDTALSLNGTNQVAQIATDPAFDITNAITVEAWVYMRTYNPNNWNMIVNKETSYELGVHGGVWKYAINGSSGWQGVSTTIPYVLNEWQHVAFTRAANTNTVKFYVNGVMAYALGGADGAGSGAIATSADYLTIGGRRGVGGNTGAFFDGMIDEVRIFSAVRSDAEIAADMHTYGPINSTNLKAYFDFNDTSGSTIVNKAEGGTTSTDLGLTNAPTLVDVKNVDSTTQPAYTQITFNRTYITAIGGWKSPATRVNFTSLVVAGGGAGGARVSTGAGGGGGAGGLLESASRSLDTSTIVAIQVGQGGVGTRTGTMTTMAAGSNGQNSLLKFGAQIADSFTAIGGGGGAGGYDTDLNSYKGLAGGSGGGASGSNTSGYSGGAALQQSGSGFTGYGNAGGMNPGCSAIRPAGGGGGAGGAGVTPQTCSPAASGAGGAGRTSTVTGSLYAGGGGGGLSGDGGVTAGAAGSGGGAAGSGGTLISGTTEYIGNGATANTGGGGGGVGISSGVIRGGFGGSGIVVIKYLAFKIPVYSGLANDTTTAGLTHTFTITGSPNSPFIRSYRWQSTTDTGTNWINISVGSGFTSASYTTPTLETATSGSRYQYRVIVTDTDGGTSMTDTSTGVFLIINARITITGSYTVMKYGNAHTDTFTVNAYTGTGTKTIRRTSTAKPNITWDTSTANIARVTVAANLSVGTYFDTLTVTDQESATTTLAVTITVLKADTVTVVVANRNDTYTASSLSYIDTFTITGLVSVDTFTVSTYGYSGTANDGTTFDLAGRPAIAGTYAIVPTYSSSPLSNYESITVTNGTLTINRKLRTISASAKPTTLKYGETSTVASSVSEGGADGTISYTSDTTSRCIFEGSALKAIEASSNCQFSTSISRGNNYETATSATYSATLTQADTLTVIVESITAITYTGNQAAVFPTIRVNGLVHTDTANSNGATFTYRPATGSGTFSATKPTNSDTYTVRADTLTVTNGLLSRYKGITYVDGSLRINRAQQFDLVFIQYQSTFGVPYKAIAYGGSGTGALSYTVSAGNASGCSITGDTVTTTSEGSCLLIATRAQDQNYETKTASAFIYFLDWRLLNSPAPVSGTGSTISLTGSTSVTLDTNVAPTITGLSTYSGIAGSTQLIIYGAGFDSSNLAGITVKFWRNILASGFSVNAGNSQITVTIPAGATSGKVTVTTPNGQAVSEFILTITS